MTWKFQNIQKIGDVPVVKWGRVEAGLSGRANHRDDKIFMTKVEALVLKDGRTMYGCCWEGCEMVSEKSPNSLTAWHVGTHEGTRRNRKEEAKAKAEDAKAKAQEKIDALSGVPKYAGEVATVDKPVFDFSTLAAFQDWSWVEMGQKLLDAAKTEADLRAALKTKDEWHTKLIDEKNDLIDEVRALEAKVAGFEGDAQAWADLTEDNVKLLQRISELEAGAPKSKGPDILPLKARITDLETQLSKRQQENENLRRALAALQVLQIPS